MTILKCKALCFIKVAVKIKLPFKFLTKLFLLLTLDAKLPSVTAQYLKFAICASETKITLD